MTGSLNGNVREKVSKGENHRLRSCGHIPAVLYGLHRANMDVEFAEMDLLSVLNNSGEHAVLDVKINGNDESAIIKEVQRDPLTRKIVHIDLQRVDKTELIHIKVPVKIVGEASIKAKGGMAQVQLEQVEVQCTPETLPRFLTADISKVPIGGRFTVLDLEISSEISVLDDPSTIIASVTYIKDTPMETETPNEAMAVHIDAAK